MSAQVIATLRVSRPGSSWLACIGPTNDQCRARCGRRVEVSHVDGGICSKCGSTYRRESVCEARLVHVGTAPAPAT